MNKADIEDLIFTKSLFKRDWDLLYPTTEKGVIDTQTIFLDCPSEDKRIILRSEVVRICEKGKTSLTFEGDYSNSFKEIAQKICERKKIDLENW